MSSAAPPCVVDQTPGLHSSRCGRPEKASRRESRLPVWIRAVGCVGKVGEADAVGEASAVGEAGVLLPAVGPVERSELGVEVEGDSMLAGGGRLEVQAQDGRVRVAEELVQLLAIPSPPHDR